MASPGLEQDGTRHRRAAVIGSGFGGLAAAIRLQAAGLQCDLFEARDKPGGRAYVYEQDGFKFDGGPTVITAPECLEELFELAGEKLSDHVDMLPVTPFYRLLWPDGDSFDYVNGPALEQQILRRSEQDLLGYEKFLTYSKQVFDKGYRELAASPFLNFRDMLRVAPDLIRLRADRSVYATVARFLRDEHLRQAFSFHSLLVGGNPFDTSAIYTLIHFLERKWGVFFPRGGTGALVLALVSLFQRLGGSLHLSTPVTKVDLIRGKGRPQHRVTTNRGSANYDIVVSNADVHHTYKRLYGAVPAARRRASKLERQRWSMSLFVLYFGTNRTYPELAHHTVLFGHRYRELLTDIFEGHELARDFSLYLHAPTATDRSMAPAGCGSFYVLSPVPHLGQHDPHWEQVGAAYAERILCALEERIMPNLRRHVITRHFITPKDFQRDLGAFQGSAFSVAPTLGQSAWFRPHNQDDAIPGLYLVGAGTHPGAGLPGVINSAKATAQLILSSPQEGCSA